MRWVLLALLACGRPRAVQAPEERLPPVIPAERPQAGPRPETPPDILLITVDGLRADHLSLYGYPRETAPGLAALAREAVVFERALTPAPWEAPALASLMTGLYPNQHGVDRGAVQGESVSGQPVLAGAHATLAERLREAGYATRAVSTTPHAIAASGFEQGFERFDALGAVEDGRVVLDALAGAELGDRPRFLWVHLRDPRAPWTERAPWFEEWAAEDPPLTAIASAAPDPDRAARQATAARWIAAYDSEIRATDEVVSAVIAKSALGPEDVIVVLGAEGQELRDHGKLGHRSSLYEEQVRVPLLVRWPRATAARVETPVSTVDLLPTLQHIATGQAPADSSGTSLVPAMTGQALPERAIPLELRATDSRFLRGLVWGDWKLVRVDGPRPRLPPRLYKLESDPGEIEDRAGLEPAVTERMTKALDAWLASAVVVPPEGAGR